MARISNKKTALMTGVALVAMTTVASAGGLALREQSAVGQGMSFAGAGTPGMGLSAMFWNPAAVTQAKGLQSESHLALVVGNSDITAGPGTSAALLALGVSQDVGKVGLIPASYAAMQLNDRWFLGVSMNATYGLGTEARPPFASQQLALKAGVVSLDINPVVGWKIADTLSIAAGPRILYLDGNFNRAIAAVSPAILNTNAALDVNDIGFGFSAGVTWTPTRWTEIALGYRSQVKLDDLSGNIRRPVLGGLGALSGVQNGISGSVTLPDMITLGARQRLNDRFTLLGTVEFTNWSKVQQIDFTNLNGPGAGTSATILTFNYRDGWFYSAGLEYDALDWMTLRTGIAFERSPVTDGIRDTSLPDADRIWLSVGATARVHQQVTVDVGFSYVTTGSVPINVVPGHPDFAQLLGNQFVGTADTDVYILSGSFRYKFHPDRVVAKY